MTAMTVYNIQLRWFKSCNGWLKTCLKYPFRIDHELTSDD